MNLMVISCLRCERYGLFRVDLMKKVTKPGKVKTNETSNNRKGEEAEDFTGFAWPNADDPTPMVLH